VDIRAPTGAAKIPFVAFEQAVQPNRIQEVVDTAFRAGSYSQTY
jgi:hypothetical protein